jgi:taurine transport system substrate-binding protein
MKKLLFALLLGMAAALPAWAQKTVTFAYQDMMNPFRWVQQSGEIEKATGYKINWKQFGGGGDVIRAMASVTSRSARSAPLASPRESARAWTSSSSGFSRTSRRRRRWWRRTAATSDGRRPEGKEGRRAFVSTTHFHLLYAMELPA